jgi:hypothetical protein
MLQRSSRSRDTSKTETALKIGTVSKAETSSEREKFHKEKCFIKRNVS